MVVSIIIGSALTGFVQFLVGDVLLFSMCFLLNGVDFSNIFIVLKKGVKLGPYFALAQAKSAGEVTLYYGVFIHTLTNFLIMAGAAFCLVRGINCLRKLVEKTPDLVVSAKCSCLSVLPFDHSGQGFSLSVLHLAA